MEMSIALAVIGLIAGVVIGGKELLQTARTRGVMDEVNDIYNAQQLFEDKYNQLPGDIWDASARLGKLSDDVTDATNGDGDGLLDTATERLAYWQHLALAGLLPGEYDAASLVPGTGIYPSQYADNIGYAVTSPGNYTLSRYTGGAGGYAFISPADAASLDENYDDSNPATGTIQAQDGTGANGSCIAAGDYDLTNDAGLACILLFSVADSSAVAVNPYSGGAVDTCGGYNVDDSKTVTCPAGQTGTYDKICRYGGVWEVDTGNYNCSDPGTYCTTTTSANTFWPDAAAGTAGVVGICLPGYSGAPTRDCGAGGTWGVAGGTACS